MRAYRPRGWSAEDVDRRESASTQTGGEQERPDEQHQDHDRRIRVVGPDETAGVTVCVAVVPWPHRIVRARHHCGESRYAWGRGMRGRCVWGLCVWGLGMRGVVDVRT